MLRSCVTWWLLLVASFAGPRRRRDYGVVRRSSTRMLLFASAGASSLLLSAVFPAFLFLAAVAVVYEEKRKTEKQILQNRNEFGWDTSSLEEQIQHAVHEIQELFHQDDNDLQHVNPALWAWEHDGTDPGEALDHEQGMTFDDYWDEREESAAHALGDKWDEMDESEQRAYIYEDIDADGYHTQKDVDVLEENRDTFEGKLEDPEQHVPTGQEDGGDTNAAHDHQEATANSGADSTAEGNDHHLHSQEQAAATPEAAQDHHAHESVHEHEREQGDDAEAHEEDGGDDGQRDHPNEGGAESNDKEEETTKIATSTSSPADHPATKPPGDSEGDATTAIPSPTETDHEEVQEQGHAEKGVPDERGPTQQEQAQVEQQDEDRDDRDQDEREDTSSSGKATTEGRTAEEETTEKVDEHADETKQDGEGGPEKQEDGSATSSSKGKEEEKDDDEPPNAGTFWNNLPEYMKKRQEGIKIEELRDLAKDDPALWKPFDPAPDGTSPLDVDHDGFVTREELEKTDLTGQWMNEYFVDHPNNEDHQLIPDEEQKMLQEKFGADSNGEFSDSQKKDVVDYLITRHTIVEPTVYDDKKELLTADGSEIDPKKVWDVYDNHDQDHDGQFDAGLAGEYQKAAAKILGDEGKLQDGLTPDEVRRLADENPTVFGDLANGEAGKALLADGGDPPNTITPDEFQSYYQNEGGWGEGDTTDINEKTRILDKIDDPEKRFQFVQFLKEGRETFKPNFDVVPLETKIDLFDADENHDGHWSETELRDHQNALLAAAPGSSEQDFDNEETLKAAVGRYDDLMFKYERKPLGMVTSWKHHNSAVEGDVGSTNINFNDGIDEKELDILKSKGTPEDQQYWAMIGGYIEREGGGMDQDGLDDDDMNKLTADMGEKLKHANEILTPEEHEYFNGLRDADGQLSHEEMMMIQNQVLNNGDMDAAYRHNNFDLGTVSAWTSDLTVAEKTELMNADKDFDGVLSPKEMEGTEYFEHYKHLHEHATAQGAIDNLKHGHLTMLGTGIKNGLIVSAGASGVGLAATAGGFLLNGRMIGQKKNSGQMRKKTSSDNNKDLGPIFRDEKVEDVVPATAQAQAVVDTEEAARSSVRPTDSFAGGAAAGTTRPSVDSATTTTAADTTSASTSPDADAALAALTPQDAAAATSSAEHREAELVEQEDEKEQLQLQPAPVKIPPPAVGVAGEAHVFNTTADEPEPTSMIPDEDEAVAVVSPAREQLKVDDEVVPASTAATSAAGQGPNVEQLKMEASATGVTPTQVEVPSNTGAAPPTVTLTTQVPGVAAAAAAPQDLPVESVRGSMEDEVAALREKEHRQQEVQHELEVARSISGAGETETSERMTRREEEEAIAPEDVLVEDEHMVQEKPEAGMKGLSTMISDEKDSTSTSPPEQDVTFAADMTGGLPPPVAAAAAGESSEEQEINQLVQQPEAGTTLAKSSPSSISPLSGADEETIPHRAADTTPAFQQAGEGATLTEQSTSTSSTGSAGEEQQQLEGGRVVPGGRVAAHEQSSQPPTPFSAEPLDVASDVKQPQTTGAGGDSGGHGETDADAEETPMPSSPEHNDEPAPPAPAAVNHSKPRLRGTLQAQAQQQMAESPDERSASTSSSTMDRTGSVDDVNDPEPKRAEALDGAGPQQYPGLEYSPEDPASAPLEHREVVPTAPAASAASLPTPRLRGSLNSAPKMMPVEDHRSSETVQEGAALQPRGEMNPIIPGGHYDGIGGRTETSTGETAPRPQALPPDTPPERGSGSDFDSFPEQKSSSSVSQDGAAPRPNPEQKLAAITSANAAAAAQMDPRVRAQMLAMAHARAGAAGAGAGPQMDPAQAFALSMRGAPRAGASTAGDLTAGAPGMIPRGNKSPLDADDAKLLALQQQRQELMVRMMAAKAAAAPARSGAASSSSAEPEAGEAAVEPSSFLQASFSHDSTVVEQTTTNPPGEDSILTKAARVDENRFSNTITIMTNETNYTTQTLHGKSGASKSSASSEQAKVAPRTNGVPSTSIWTDHKETSRLVEGRAADSQHAGRGTAMKDLRPPPTSYQDPWLQQWRKLRDFKTQLAEHESGVVVLFFLLCGFLGTVVGAILVFTRGGCPGGCKGRRNNTLNKDSVFADGRDTDDGEEDGPATVGAAASSALSTSRTFISGASISSSACYDSTRCARHDFIAGSHDRSIAPSRDIAPRNARIASALDDQQGPSRTRSSTTPFASLRYSELDLRVVGSASTYGTQLRTSDTSLGATASSSSSTDRNKTFTAVLQDAFSSAKLWRQRASTTVSDAVSIRKLSLFRRDEDFDGGLETDLTTSSSEEEEEDLRTEAMERPSDSPHRSMFMQGSASSAAPASQAFSDRQHQEGAVVDDE
ncbi:unnamed protein product [Amoebophrya sp. A120]|nr:unnamed protein product [Amoebophrya sp. A120]|eukprot:GSA120T00011557001.1